MSDIHPKKLVILYILDILQKYTDEESQTEPERDTGYFEKRV